MRKWLNQVVVAAAVEAAIAGVVKAEVVEMAAGLARRGNPLVEDELMPRQEANN